MKSTKIIATCLLILLIGATSAFASGKAMIGTYDDGSSSLVVVAKFADNFSSAEADNMAAALGTVLGMTGTTGAQLYMPSQVAAMFGSSDGDYIKDGVKSQYTSYGFDSYIFLDVKKVAGVSGATGINVRIDLWIADMAAQLGMPGDYLYVASLEVPQMYVSQLQSLLSLY